VSQKEPKKKKRSVSMSTSKGGCDVFFCRQYSRLAKACRGDAAQSLQGGGPGAGIIEFRDSDAEWVRDKQVE